LRRSGERQATVVAPNVLNLTFEASAPNRKWIADFTYVWTTEGWLYVVGTILMIGIYLLFGTNQFYFVSG